MICHYYALMCKQILDKNGRGGTTQAHKQAKGKESTDADGGANGINNGRPSCEMHHKLMESLL